MVEDLALATSEAVSLRVLAERRPVRWHIAPGDVPADASAELAAFLRRWALRAVLGVPLVARDRGEVTPLV
jgi:hypothetical protein